jgi:putative membrane protein
VAVKNLNIWKGVAAGAVGGLRASWVMDEFQYAWIRISSAGKQRNGNDDSQESNDEPATVKAAELVSKNVFGHELSASEKKVGANAVHYATGGTSGAVYGAAAELIPGVTSGGGLPFGTAIWLAVDEGAVPLLGLSKGPTQYPLSTHVYALASHFVYGVTTEAVRRALRKTILG